MYVCVVVEQFNANSLMSAKRSPQDVVSYLREVTAEDTCVYEACKLPAFYSKYFTLADKLGVKGRKTLKMSRRTRCVFDDIV